MIELTNDLIDAIENLSVRSDYSGDDDDGVNQQEELDTSMDLLEEISSLLHQGPPMFLHDTSEANDTTAPLNPSFHTKESEDVDVNADLDAGYEYNNKGVDNTAKGWHMHRNTNTGMQILLPRMAPDDDEEVDIFMIAARNRINRDKMKSKHPSLLKQVSSLCGDTFQMKRAGNDGAGEAENTSNSTEDEEEIRCFVEFRKEVQEFYEKYKDQSADIGRFVKDLNEFVDKIEVVYIHEKLGARITEKKRKSKVVRLINAFIGRCRKNQDKVELEKLCNVLFKVPVREEKKILCKFKYWTCKTCGKADLLFDENKCSVCGRKKRHVVLPSRLVFTQKLKDPITEEEEFLAGGKVCSNINNSNNGSDARIRRQYLYRKVDYDIERRGVLKDEVKRVLDSVKATIGT